MPFIATHRSLHQRLEKVLLTSGLILLLLACAGPLPEPVESPTGRQPESLVHTRPPDDIEPGPVPAAVIPAAPAPSPVEQSPADFPAAATSQSGQLIGKGLASWYGNRFHGQRTASGERYDMHGFTAAHRTLPFGTRVRVRSVLTGKEVVVRINDRGPYRHQRIIDLSLAAINALGVRHRGITSVELLRE